jgi:hypothetical protein
LERRSPPPAPSAASSVAPSDAQDWAIGIDDELPGLLALCVSADCGVIVYHAHGSSLSSGRPTGCMLFAYSQPVRSRVSESANMMPYSFEYFNERVLGEIENWPGAVLLPRR